jgi:CDP-diacylglycerol pyrophosphatase
VRSWFANRCLWPTVIVSRLRRLCGRFGAAAAILALTLAPDRFAAALQSPELPRDALWRVVQVCKEADRLTHAPLPCIAVQPPTSSRPGYALVPAPLTPEFLVVPTAKIAGIESPGLLGAGAPNWWAYAWETRHVLEERIHSVLPHNAVVLGINSVAARSQDQLHIHVGCIAPWAQRLIIPYAERARRRWTDFPAPLLAQRFRWSRLDSEDLNRANPFDKLADDLPRKRAGMGARGLAVLGWTFVDGRNGFLLFSNRQNDTTGDRGAGADFIDPECTAFKQS